MIFAPYGFLKNSPPANLYRLPSQTMNTHLRTHHITRLIDGIRVIAPGAEFERFGGCLLNHYLGVPLSHRGLNVLGHPVGGTIDTIDDTDRVAGEYSTEQTYFHGSMTKATGDARHVLKFHPDAQDIFLLSSQEAPIGKIADFKQAMAKCPEFTGRTLHVFDSRRIAEILVDHLLVSDTAVDQLALRLPVLKTIRDEHAANLSIPETDYGQHVKRPDVATEIAARLARSPCLVVWGLAGSGKSDAAAEFATLHQGAYELRIWLEGNEITRVEDLRAVPLSRGGDSRNVSTLLSTRRCLVVIDDAQVALPPAELAGLCRDGSHVIVTQRDEEKTGFELPLMSREQASTLLNRDVTCVCPDDIWAVIWATVGGHPLSLGLMNAAVAEGASWSDIAADCAAVGELEDGRQRLADRLLARVRPVLDRELSVFAWAGRPTCDRGFLNAVVQPAGLRKLRRHGLMAPDRANTLRLHDVVFSSLKASAAPGAERLTELNNLLEAYIAQVSGQPGLAFISVAAGMKRKLEELARAGDRRPAFLYALAEAWQPNELVLDILGDPMMAVEQLQDRLGSDVRVEVSAIIETIEGLYRAEKISLGSEGAKAQLRSRLPVFDRLAALNGLSARQGAEIQHHKGKSLNILGERKAARALFEQVLAGSCPLHESRLQLVRIYAREDEMAPQAAALADEILTAASRPDEVSNSVILAAVEVLPWGRGAWRESLMAQHADAIENAIIEATAAGLDQGYQTFAAVGRHWVWQDPDRFQKVWEQLPPRTPTSVAGDRERFNYGEILQQAAKTFSDVASDFRSRALEFFEAVVTPDAFQAQKHGQLLIEMGRPGDALGMLEAIPEFEANPWVLYWLSKAHLDIGDAPKALERIDDALGLLSEKAQSYRSTFQAHRYEVRSRLNDADAIEDLIEAQRVCTDPKFKRQLEMRLAKASIVSAP
jgi:tetratricopeptide (TPR) repeat protein